MKEKYAVIAAHRDVFDVCLMCRALGVSPSGFYAAQARERRAPSIRAVADEALRVEVSAVHRRTRGRYGAPRVHRELQAQGTRASPRSGSRA